jgi:hypothetical protein
MNHMAYTLEKNRHVTQVMLDTNRVSGTFPHATRHTPHATRHTPHARFAPSVQVTQNNRKFIPSGRLAGFNRIPICGFSMKRLFSQIAIILLLLIVAFPFLTENIFSVYDLDDLVIETPTVLESRKVTNTVYRSVKSETLVVVALYPQQRHISVSTTPEFYLRQKA